MTKELSEAIIAANDKLQGTHHSLDDVKEIRVSHQLGGMFDLYTNQGQNVGLRLYASVNAHTVAAMYPQFAKQILNLFKLSEE